MRYSMKRFIELLLIGCLVGCSHELLAADRPNIVWVSCEDISAHLGCYGDLYATTPNIDQLASEGVRYTHAFVAAGVCAPCRSTIITGMYQTTIGTQHIRSSAQLPDHIKPFTIDLRDARTLQR
ncbi:MAG: sulfatase-like hydrolase/transferase [Planctomycetes bacterium]|nr:sulfatase-like hydrolase/transferase [Planctomycetota bacterium]